ncbi:MAG: hypothetical protein JKX97_01295 [Candidatus Lindowbacteria bacterium]|nr:hypothetical protein [Candidatus Lindowbacteria bacterium]
MEHLRDISKIDQEIARLSEKMEPYIQRKNRLESDEKAAADKITKLDATILVLQKSTAAGDLEIRTLSSKKDAETSKLDSIQSVKAAEAVQAELNAIASLIDSTEEKTLVEMMELEEAEAKRKVNLEERSSLRKELDELVLEIQKTEREIETKIGGLEEKRRDMAASLPAAFKKSYMALIDTRKYANPIVAISEYSCPVCGGIFRPNTQAYMASGKPDFCITCQRIMIR